MGTYPYPPETYANVFAQLTAIVQGDPPTLPDGFSDDACDFVGRWYVYIRDFNVFTSDLLCSLMKEPSRRATYSELLEHPFLVQDAKRGKDGVDMIGWVLHAIEWQEKERIKTSATADLGL
jgi:mitogen-activated protein kinase kinase